MTLRHVDQNQPFPLRTECGEILDKVKFAIEGAEIAESDGNVAAAGKAAVTERQRAIGGARWPAEWKLAELEAAEYQAEIELVKLVTGRDY